MALQELIYKGLLRKSFCYDKRMSDIHTKLSGLTLSRPDPKRDASFALEWFTSPYGNETLLSMGNPQHAIASPTLAGEESTLRSFLDLEKAGKQLTWMMRMDNKTIGAAWIELEKQGTVRAPSIHLMIGDASYRGKGIGQMVMRFMIDYVRDVLKGDCVYSRNLVSNEKIAHINAKLGLVNDGEPYVDEDGLLWQNTKKAL